MPQTHHLSVAAYERLKAELDDLTTRGRIEIARKIETARELGDLSENGDYHAAKEEQGKMEGRIRQLMEWMIELSPPRDDAAAVTRDALLQAAAFAYAGAGRGPLDELVLNVRAWVREHLERPIYLDDLARIGGMSRFHFNRVFAKAAGATPMRFVREMRVDAARSLLLSTAMPLREM